MILTEPVTRVLIQDLVVNPDNPRSDLGDIAELANSIDAQGILQPLLVVEAAPYDSIPIKYMIVDGHRRFAALQLLHSRLDRSDTIPVRVVEMDRTARILAAVATQGKPLEPLDEARAFQQLVDLGLTQRQIAERAGCNQSHVSRRLTLLELPATAAKALADGKVTVREAENYARTGSVAPTPKPKTDPRLTSTMTVEEATSLRRQNQQLREIAEKARAAVVDVKDQVTTAQAAFDDTQAERDALALEVAELRQAITELEEEEPAALVPIPDTGGAQLVVQCNNCDTIVAVPHHPTLGRRVVSDLGYCPACESSVASWIVRPSARAVDLPEIELDDMFPTAADPAPPVAAEPAGDPVWATKQPWGSYRMSADARILNVLTKSDNPDTCRHVIAYEQANDRRVDIIDAARTRLSQLTTETAA